MSKAVKNNSTSEVTSEIIESGGTLEAKADEPMLYSKRQFLNSENYKKYKDLLNVLLEDNSFYSKENVNQMIEKYLKGKVK